MQVSNENIVKAIDLAIETHAEQKDKFGRVYLYHLSQVASMTRNDEEFIVAWLHDFLKDSTVRTQEEALAILQEEFPEEIVTAIKCMTQLEDMSREEYIAQVAKNSLAAKVKYYDIRSNCDIMRLKLLPVEEALELLNKYKRDINQFIDVGVIKRGQIKFIERAEISLKEKGEK